MNYLAWLVPLALGMGVVGLAAFLWSMRSGQYEDLDGAAERVLLSDAADAPLPGEKSQDKVHAGTRLGRRNVRPAGGVASENGKQERVRRDGSF